MPKYLEAPVPTKGWPSGIPYIIGNEAAERFSFYGMKSILIIFMTAHMVNHAGQPDYMTDEDAKYWFHMFNAAVYFTPLLGGLLSDIFLGKYKTIILLSIVYCLGHFMLAIDETRFGLGIGLALIAVGAGGIKPCVSAHVGDQFSKSNQTLLEKAFSWFYFSINLGAAISTLLTPILLDKFGPWLAFGVPGVLMVMATVLFWMGRNKFVHIPPGGKKWVQETFSKEGITILLKLSIIYCFVAMFWALFDQTGSAW
ncbi:MAG: MFS transporter, partial [Phycisphaerae bacterium]|nr:MFS transporter [Phycisphaerae bacterium]